MSNITNEIKKRRTVRNHFPSGCRKDYFNRKISVIWRCNQSGGKRKGEKQQQSMQSLTGWKLKKKEVFLLRHLFFSSSTVDTVLTFWIRLGIRISQRIRIVH